MIACFGGESGLRPGVESAVEDHDVVESFETELPPQAGRPDAVDGVVDDDRRVVTDPGLADGRGELLRRRRRKRGLAVRIGQPGDLVDEHRTGQVPLQVGVAAGGDVRAVGVEAEMNRRVDDAQTSLAETGVQFIRGDQRYGVHG